MKKPPNNIFTTFGKLKEGATTIVPWEFYQKRKVHTLKGTLTVVDYKNITDPLQKSDIDYKVY